MLLAWSEGQGSSIHDHSNSHCFMKMLAGSLREIRYEWPQNDADTVDADGVHEMKVVGESVLHTDQVTYINDSLGLHRVENKSHTQPAVSLHLYIPAFDSCRSFDQRTGHSNKVTFTFHSKLGKRTPFGRFNV
ncbi:cysteine dioxygenase type 1-like protein [Leptotrombidium deliense]|uniref:Cysteine dioxygenase n=1 Tax=Leptotrombidium deliense TaxID=299467 RepID=A0A443SSV2_9ACAR|nr:cysteine dioxygenase type 1-like protein [Leptotrombidium deliense]